MFSEREALTEREQVQLFLSEVCLVLVLGRPQKPRCTAQMHISVSEWRLASSPSIPPIRLLPALLTPSPTSKLSFLELGFHALLPKACSLLSSAILTTWMVWPAPVLVKSLLAHLLSSHGPVWSVGHSPSPYFRHVLLVFHFFIQLALPNLAS